MGKLSFDDIKSIIDYNNSLSIHGYEFPLMPKLNSIIGNLDSRQIHVISGLSSAGTSSFVDENYVLSTLIQWYEMDLHDRPNLKIFYYSLKDPELKKIQSLLTVYLKLVYKVRTDLPTLNNKKGKLYNLADDELAQSAIEASTPFFDEILDEEVLDIHAGQHKPSSIFNTVASYMDTIGETTSKHEYVRSKGHEEDLIMLIIDDTDYLLNDNDGMGVISGYALHDKLQGYLKTLKFVYGVTPVVIVPSEIPIIRSAKDTEPHFRHLGSYGKIADKGICIYNPVAEHNVKFYPDESIYKTSKGNILLRTWHVVKNVDGLESIHDRMLFLPGTGYLIEHTINHGDDSIIDMQDVLVVLSEDSPFTKINEDEEQETDE
jgi:hypothetical protein